MYQSIIGGLVVAGSDCFLSLTSSTPTPVQTIAVPATKEAKSNLDHLFTDKSAAAVPQPSPG
jgi:hypothetical protein